MSETRSPGHDLAQRAAGLVDQLDALLDLVLELLISA